MIIGNWQFDSDINSRTFALLDQYSSVCSTSNMKWVCLSLLLAVLVGSFASPTTPKKAMDIFGNLFREPPPPPGSETKINSRLILDQRITQKLDHFDDSNTATWSMRYFSNSEHYVPGGPLFIYVGGEWDITWGWVTGGHMYDMAKEMNGHVFYTEHRFYGQSLPTR